MRKIHPTEHEEQVALMSLFNKAGNRKGMRHGGGYLPEYNAWCNMKARCHNMKHPRYKEWGGKGIAVCERWRDSFVNFIQDMGYRPSVKHSLDRIDGSMGYAPSNCRWATAKEQSENRPSWVNTIKFNGETMTMTGWAIKIGISRKSLYGRLENGWTIEKALTTPRIGHIGCQK